MVGHNLEELKNFRKCMMKDIKNYVQSPLATTTLTFM